MPFHLFQYRRVDWAKGYIVRLQRQRAGQLGLVMGRDPQLQTRSPDRRNIRLVKVFLAQMHPVTAQLNCQLPMVIDHQHRTMGRAEVTGLAQLGTEVLLRFVLQAHLHQLDPQRQHPPQPCHIVENRVKTRQGHSMAFPKTGVDGAAISRASIGSACAASAPASTARPKACAIAAGSPAFATAVFSKTAS